MPGIVKRVFALLFLAGLTLSAIAATPAEQSAAKLARRLLAGAADNLRFEQIDAADGKDVFEIETVNRQVTVRGNSALSMAVGLNWYLKYYCHCSVSLNEVQLKVPKPLPVLPAKVRMNAWAQSRYFLNYCTFGYSMSWWNWPQWEVPSSRSSRATSQEASRSP